MRRILLPLVVLLLAALPAHAAEKLKVVATIPDLADLVREIGGEEVEVAVLAKGASNLHAVTARPSHLVAMHKAELFVQIGLSLESSFVPGLLESCGNPRIQPGAQGFVNASEGYAAIGVPVDLSRKGGDVHPHGNPHMYLDPRAGARMAERVLAGLVAVRPAKKAYFEERHAAWSKRLAAAAERWSKAGAAWKGRRVAGYHGDYDYVVAAYGMEQVGTIEELPGIAPTPNHLAAIVARLKERAPVTVLVASWSNNATVARVAEASGSTVCELPDRCDAEGKLSGWIAMMDELHARLAKAFGTPWEAPVEAPAK